MEKIVVMTGGTDHDINLIKCLKELFPEVEIDVRHRKPGNYESVEPDKAETDDNGINETTEKYLSFL